MTDYTMTKGMSDWMAKYNQFINEQAVGAKTFGSEVFTLSNGASWPNSDESLTTLELGNGYRIIQVEFDLKIADYQAAKSKPVVSIPLKYAPKIGWHPIQLGSGTNHVRWNIGVDGTMTIESVLDESGVGANFWFPMDTIYITHD